METHSEITDEEFIPFLENLGVETCKKSFEWMLNDKDFTGILSWLYHNLDHNNALTAREECRYAELQKHDQLMSSEDLEKYITDLQSEYDGLCLPGDKDAVDDIKFDIEMQKERLHMLERHEKMINDLLKQNNLVKNDLNKVVSKLHAEEQLLAEEESTIAEKCITLSNEVETVTEDVIDVIADTLDLYRSSAGNKDISRKFLTFGPFESYQQNQALFQSNFELYASKKFGEHQKNIVNDDVMRMTLVEAKSMKERLFDATINYIDAKCELSGEQAKLVQLSNYSDVHHSLISTYSVEAQNAISLLEQEECILQQQIQVSVKDFVDYRFHLAVESTAKAALAVRQQMSSDVTHLLDLTQHALILDRLLYFALRLELYFLHEFIQFAAELREYFVQDDNEVVSRIDAMNTIVSEHAALEDKLRTSDPLVSGLYDMLSVPHNMDAAALVKAHSELHNSVKKLGDDIEDLFEKKEAVLGEIRTASLPLYHCVYEGSTKQPRVWDPVVSSLHYRLHQLVEETDSKVLTASEQYSQIKDGDKHHLRKLWQWFITDPSKLVAAVDGVQGKSYS